jgi:hypothetical protein
MKALAASLEASRAGAAALEKQLAELRPLPGQLAELQVHAEGGGLCWADMAYRRPVRGGEEAHLDAGTTPYWSF